MAYGQAGRRLSNAASAGMAGLSAMNLLAPLAFRHDVAQWVVILPKIATQKQCLLRWLGVRSLGSQKAAPACLLLCLLRALMSLQHMRRHVPSCGFLPRPPEQA